MFQGIHPASSEENITFVFVYFPNPLQVIRAEHTAGIERREPAATFPEHRRVKPQIQVAFARPETENIQPCGRVISNPDKIFGIQVSHIAVFNGTISNKYGVDVPCQVFVF